MCAFTFLANSAQFSLFSWHAQVFKRQIKPDFDACMYVMCVDTRLSMQYARIHMHTHIRLRATYLHVMSGLARRDSLGSQLPCYIFLCNVHIYIRLTHYVLSEREYSCWEGQLGKPAPMFRCLEFLVGELQVYMHAYMWSSIYAYTYDEASPYQTIPCWRAPGGHTCIHTNLCSSIMCMYAYDFTSLPQAIPFFCILSWS